MTLSNTKRRKVKDSGKHGKLLKKSKKKSRPERSVQKAQAVSNETKEIEKMGRFKMSRVREVVLTPAPG